MANFDLMRQLQLKNDRKIVLLVVDGLGGLPVEPGGPTELEVAQKPVLDRLASEGTLGQMIPIRPGITPGSGPAHLALFGYDPIQYNVGRGVLEATGIGMEVKKGDIAARGNFCTLDSKGMIIDRRAGRIPSDEAIPLVERLSGIRIPDVEVDVQHVREYRFAIVMRGEDLEPELEDTDPQATGVQPHPVRARKKSSQRTADLFERWVAEARARLAEENKANGLTLRGFSTDPGLPQFPEIFGLKAACIAVYPMYRGASRLVGMEIEDFQGDTPEDEFRAASDIWDNYDFFFIHIKKTDSMGEDGNFQGKVGIIETVDHALPSLLKLEPDVLCVTCDHSTPARMKKHSWHPVPTLLWAPATGLPDHQTTFGERACAQGGFGTFPTIDLMPLLMAHADRLEKFGA
ncbi:MAG TPA: 2,3-bisphosphoglycerate-independent phosphoglycerate mutase [Anaerolineae bacterium]|nr:MAG: phosphoglycerate mutase [Anaerolineae bacterium SM23_ 63]HEY45025.1 2,3-bisphosphoglycerate-independent phosphoglycerate mutase [Anaerolineae bacterium]